MDQLSKRYRLGELIGQGGMAKVYRAEDELLGRVVAVKVLREQYASDQAFLDRFIQEARSAASLSHQNIVNVYDVGDDGGTYYIVMEYVDGTSLKDLIQQQAPLSTERIVGLSSQICDGLQAAHGRNLVHRDIKPQNVLVTADGRVKIADFGIARALGEASFSETGQVFGSIHYLSPEQAQGKQATLASDIYALGVVCYEMMTGRLPFEGETVVGVALRHIQEPPRPPRELNPSIPPTLESIVLKALAKDPAERYPSARTMAQALRQYAQIGEQATGIVTPVRVRPAATPSAYTGRTPAVAAAPQGMATGRARSGGSFLLMVLAILALLSVLGLCALGAATYQSYNDRFAEKFGSILSPLFPTALATSSGSEEMAIVPRLEGMEAAEAKAQVESRGLQYAEGPPEESDKMPSGRVIRQSLQPGITVTRGLEVLVVLSKGTSAVEVPPVVGLKFSEAEDKLEDLGFQVVREDRAMRGQPKDRVFDQMPTSGTRVPRGSKVVLGVTREGNKITVPNVVGKPEAEAKKILADAGLRVSRWVDYQGHDRLPDWLLQPVSIGSVLSTQPPAGTEVEPNTEVSIGVRKD